MYAGPVGWFGGAESEFAVGIRSALLGKVRKKWSQYDWSYNWDMWCFLSNMSMLLPYPKGQLVTKLLFVLGS